MPRFAITILAAGAALAACTKSTPPMVGTSSGAAPESGLSAAASERAGAGCPNTSMGVPRIVGSTGSGHPEVSYTGRPAGTAGSTVAQRIEPGGMADNCN
ncbi:hypothetical protein [Siccirubricoccus sp. G192]|uniref:hypothetical protein n=1 Tax=Siccirubricoccus sp. G192 TaxID=2849651 RepID=UPI001C2CA6FB|nr:hypothetical protein [Siccirubricoccus sp. G192]MBV1796227.1 hypothetical protein [Siccirubricoccus sp. G192]